MQAEVEVGYVGYSLGESRLAPSSDNVCILLQEDGLPKTPDKTPSCWKMFCDFTGGCGLRNAKGQGAAGGSIF